MAMNNPHNPEKNLWDAYTSNMNDLLKDPHNQSLRENADYYYDQWEKQVEKKVAAAIKDQRIKETEAERNATPKVKPKADKLRSK